MHRTRISARERVQMIPEGESRVKESCAPECDINRIVAKYRKTGLIEHLARNPGRYQDMADPIDYHAAMNLVIDAQDSFAALPANVRKRFENEPMQLLAFVQDENNREEMYELGLAERPVVQSDIVKESTEKVETE